jgi:hypothetical protein
MLGWGKILFMSHEDDSLPLAVFHSTVDTIRPPDDPFSCKTVVKTYYDRSMTSPPIPPEYTHKLSYQAAELCVVSTKLSP